MHPTNKILNRIRKRAGVTLVETLIGIFIFVLVFAAAISGLKYSSMIKGLDEEIANSNAILTYIVEDIRARAFSDIYNKSEAQFEAFFAGADAPPGISDLQNAVIDIIPTISADDKLLKLDISLTWDSPSGKLPAQTITYYLTDTD